MNTTLLLTGLLLLAPAAYTIDLAADAVTAPECMGTPCDQVNRVCGKLFGAQCLGFAAAEPDCMGPVCDQVNAVCERVGGTQCLGRAAGTPECVGTPCDEINLVCEAVTDRPCVRGAADEQVQCATVEPWYRYCTAAVGAADRACEKVVGSECVDQSTTAVTDCMGTPCDQINRVCQRVGGAQCLGATAEVDPPVDCASSVCTEVNERVCQPLFGIDCVYVAGGRA